LMIKRVPCNPGILATHIGWRMQPYPGTTLGRSSWWEVRDGADWVGDVSGVERALRLRHLHRRRVTGDRSASPTVQSRRSHQHHDPIRVQVKGLFGSARLGLPAPSERCLGFGRVMGSCG
jgi:hypothetical protein